MSYVHNTEELNAIFKACNFPLIEVDGCICVLDEFDAMTEKELKEINLEQGVEKW